MGDVYSAALARIKAQGVEKSRLGMAALMWISHSQRPLQADELSHALAVEIGSMDLDADNAPSIVTVLSCCQGLVTMDKESSVVRLIHFTLQEYLSSHPEFFDRAHSTISETCLTYLSSRQVKALSLTASRDRRGTPLLEYSSVYWGTHAKIKLSDCAKSLALELFCQYDKHISAKSLLEKVGCNLDPQNEHLLFTGLHCVSFFGIVEVVTTLIEMRGCDIDQRDCTGATPLIWATRNGHSAVVKLLQEREDVSPNNPDEDQSSLSWAARKNHKGAMKQQPRREGVSPDTPDKSFYQTPLLWTSNNGNEEVKLLLKREDVNPDKPDEEGQTSLLWAAESGNEEVVMKLLEREDVDPGKPDAEGRTPLLWAARKGHVGISKLLLSRGDVNPNKPDNGGRTPLLWAARKGHEGMVELLLEREDVDPNKPDGRDQTALLWAARNGHVEVVGLLLEREDINLDKPDKKGRTASEWATIEKHNGVLELLHARKPTAPSTI